MTHGIGPFTAYEARHGHARGIDWEAFGHWLVGVVGYVGIGMVIGCIVFGVMAHG